MCVSKIEMSPLTAKLKCPHGRGKDIHESEAVTEARGDGFG
jgi:cytochrome c-type biogenesis protein CcmH/NrfF